MTTGAQWRFPKPGCWRKRSCARNWATATLSHLGFLHDHDEAAEGVANGSLQMAFLMKPFPMDAFEDIVGQGQRLPRKSTFFYPKLPTGLVINRIDGEI